jgi:hypothetical protein
MRVWIVLLFLAFPLVGRAEVILSNLAKPITGTAQITSGSISFGFNATGATNLSSATLRFYNGHGVPGTIVAMQAAISLGGNQLATQSATSLVDLGGNYYDATFSLVGLSPWPFSGANNLVFSNISAAGGPNILYSALASTASGWDVNTSGWSGFTSGPSTSGNIQQISISSVPEPGTMVLSAWGLIVIGVIVFLRKKAKIRLAVQ